MRQLKIEEQREAKMGERARKRELQRQMIMANPKFNAKTKLLNMYSSKNDKLKTFTLNTFISITNK